MLSFNYKNVLVTGASRGIGLELVQQISKLDGVKRIFACYRSTSTAEQLMTLAKGSNGLIIPLMLEVKAYDSYKTVCETVAQQVGNEGLNLLVNNAGIFIRGTFEDMTPAEMIETYEVNTVAPMLFSRAMLPVLSTSAKAGCKTLIANISSLLGSIEKVEDTHFVEGLSYRSSKAALNMISKRLSHKFKDQNIIIASFHPGHVQTDLGGSHAPVTVEDSSKGLIEQFDKATLGSGGLLIAYTGDVLPY